METIKVFEVSAVYICGRILETKEHITSKALNLFKTFGIKSVSMDDLARELGMSKKTIYQYFKDKRELVNEVFIYDLEQDKKACMAYFAKSTNAIQKLLDLTGYINDSLKNMNPALLYDIKKYYPNCWSIFHDFSRDFIFHNMKKNLEEGIAQGLYRDYLNPNITASLYVSMIRQIILPDFLMGEKMSFTDIHREAVSYHMHAICSPKGLNYLKKHLNT